MTDLGTLLSQEDALRRVAKTNEDSIAAYRRACARLNILGSAVDRISRRDAYGSLQEEVDSLRGIAIEAMRKVSELE